MRRTTTLAALIFVCASASAADAQRYQLKEDTKLFGFMPGHTLANAEGVLPFDKSYGQLSPAQQGSLKSAYVEMGETDRPPFPIGGLKAIYEPITEGQQRLLASGTFRADVEVDERGDPIAVAVYHSPSKSVTKFVSNILMLSKFKPASCSGSPCKMGFPVRITFDTRLKKPAPNPSIERTLADTQSTKSPYATSQRDLPWVVGMGFFGTPGRGGHFFGSGRVAGGRAPGRVCFVG